MEDIFAIKFPIEVNVKENVILRFSNKQGGAYNIFSYYWQCFAWAATIGFLRNERRPLSSKTEKIFTLNTMRGNDGEKDAQALICMCIARTGSVDIMKDPNKAILMISEYANGGFYHIMKLMKNGENTFNDFEKVKQEIFSRNYDTVSADNSVLAQYEEEIDESVKNIILEDKTEQTDDTPWSKDEIERLVMLYENNFGIERISLKLKRPTSSVEEQLGIMGYISMPLNVNVSNTKLGGIICTKQGEVVYTDKANLKIINNKVYRFNFKPQCLTVKDVYRTNDESWIKGEKKLVAYPDSSLYVILTTSSLDNVEDFFEGNTIQENKIKVNGIWYNFYGNVDATDGDTDSTDEDDTSFYTPQKHWSAIEKKELAAYYSSGMDIEKLANFFETNEQEVRNMIEKLGL